MILGRLLLIVVILFPISEVTLAVLKRAKSATAQVEDRGSMMLLWMVISAAIMVAIGFRWVKAAQFTMSARLDDFLALVFMVSGLLIRWWSILTLGRLFTVNVAIQRDHAVVQKGLYKYVRHPSYAGLLLAFLGLGVSFRSWLSLTALMVPITLAVANRIAKEEDLLRTALGASYGDYCARTKRLIPWLI
jgi:protein-S-isoprenylcysteine O-methyltransferase Ste14